MFTMFITKNVQTDVMTRTVSTLIDSLQTVGGFAGTMIVLIRLIVKPYQGFSY